MKLKTVLLIISVCAAFSSSISQQTKKTTVLFENRSEISLQCEGTDGGVQLSLQTADPVALRTLLMQGFQLYVCGATSDTTEVSFPSARTVSSLISHHPGEVKATVQGEREKRPDMRPLVAALNKAAVVISRNGLVCDSLRDGYEVSINPSDGTLSYQIILPENYVAEGKYSIILKSQPDQRVMEDDEFSSQGFIKRSTENRPQPLGANERGGESNQRKKIEIWFDFD